eukprot:6112040-Prymnesium_polylepis.1
MCAAECATAEGACHKLAREPPPSPPQRPRPRAAGGVCVRSGSPAATSVGLVSLGMCAPQGAPCKGAGGLWVRRARGARIDCGGARRAHAVLCGRAARIRSLATSREAVGKLL